MVFNGIEAFLMVRAGSEAPVCYSVTGKCL